MASNQEIARKMCIRDSRKDARCRLGDGKQVYKILFGYPPAFRYDFVLNQWNLSLIHI